MIYQDEIINEKFKGLEGDWINFKWINIDEIENYNIYPENIKLAIKNLNKIYHFTENLIKNPK